MSETIKYCPAPIPDHKSFFFDHVHIFWNEQISFHQSAEWEISYIVKGSGSRIIGDQVETFSSGEIILIPPNIGHAWHFSEFDHDQYGKIENITIIFPEALLEKMSDFPEARSSAVLLKAQKQALTFNGETLLLLQSRIKQMVAQDDNEQLASLFTIISLVASSDETRVVGYSKRQSKSALKMQDLSRFLIQNYQRKITLDEISKQLGMNRSSFCTFFRRERKKSFFGVLNEYRVECACQMLRETNLNITEICFATGFGDVPYFNRRFKKIKGMTPKQYRTTHGQEE